jgi:hypothetical protein
MEQTLTEEEILVVYQKKQSEPFPRRKLWLGAFYAIILLGGGMSFYLFLFWLAMKLLNVN